MDEQRIKEVFSDEAFVKSLLEMEEPADVQAALGEKGIELTMDEIMQLREQIVKAAESGKSGDELSLDELDEAAGGSIIGALVAVAVYVGVAAGVAGAGGTMLSIINRWRW